MNIWQKMFNMVGTILTIAFAMVTGLYLVGSVVKAIDCDWTMVFGMLGCASIFGWLMKGSIWTKKKIVHAFRTK